MNFGEKARQKTANFPLIDEILSAMNSIGYGNLEFQVGKS